MPTSYANTVFHSISSRVCTVVRHPIRSATHHAKGGADVCRRIPAHTSTGKFSLCRAVLKSSQTLVDVSDLFSHVERLGYLCQRITHSCLHVVNFFVERLDFDTQTVDVVVRC